MKLMEFIWDEIVYGGHWASLSAPAIALSLIMILNLEIRLEFILMIYFATQCIYTYNHYKEITNDILSNAPRVNHLKRYENFLPYIVALYGISFFALLFYFSNKFSLYLGSFLLLLGLLFTSHGKNLSSRFMGFKNIYISLCWGGLVLFTAVYYKHPINLSVILFFTFVFLRFFIDSTFFDIKDIDADKKKNLLTLPIIFGEKNKCINFLHLMNIISSIPIAIGVLYRDFPTYTLFILLTIIYNALYLEKSKGNENEILSISYIFADGEYCFWPAYLFFGMLLLAG